MSDGKTLNINIGGGNIGGLQIGDNNSQTITQNIGDGQPTVEQVFEVVEKSLPADVAEEMQASVIQPLCSMAALPLDEQKSEDVKERAEPLYQRLIPYAPQIAKGLATFGAAALESLANRNPIVAGLCAVCQAAKAGT